MSPGLPPLRVVSFLSALAVAGMPESGRAAHPFLTDDTGTQGAGNWQLELLAQQNRNRATADAGAGTVLQDRRLTALNPVLTYGLADSLDLAVGLNHVRNRVTEDGIVTDEASGMSDSTVDLKWRFYQSDAFSLAVKPVLSLPTGNENRGLGTGRTSYGATLIATYDAGAWTFSGNVAYFRLRFSRPQDETAARDHLWRVSGGATWSLGKGIRLAGEVGVKTNEARDDPFLPGRNGQFAMLGAIYSPDKNVDLDIGVRKALNHAEPDTVVLIGATFRW